MVPSEVPGIVALYRRLAPEGMEIPEFVVAARTLQEVQDRTDKGPEELADRVCELEQRARELEHRCDELGPMRREVAERQQKCIQLVSEKRGLDAKMKEEKQGLKSQAKATREHLRWMQGEVKRMQHQIGGLGRRFLDRMGGVQETEDRFAISTERPLRALLLVAAL